MQVGASSWGSGSTSSFTDVRRYLKSRRHRCRPTPHPSRLLCAPAESMASVFRGPSSRSRRPHNCRLHPSCTISWRMLRPGCAARDRHEPWPEAGNCSRRAADRPGMRTQLTATLMPSWCLRRRRRPAADESLEVLQAAPARVGADVVIEAALGGLRIND